MSNPNIPKLDDTHDELGEMYRALNFYLQQLTSASGEVIMQNARRDTRPVSEIIQMIKDLELGATETEVEWSTDFITGLPEVPTPPTVTAEAFLIKRDVTVAEVIEQARLATGEEL